MTSHPKLTTGLAILATSLWGYLAIPFVKAQLEPLTGARETSATQAPKAQPEPATPAGEGKPTAKGSASWSLQPIRARLQEHRTVQAELKQQVSIGTRQFQASGTYLQASNLRVRIELEYEFRTYPAHLLEVCDGQVLWSRKTVGKEESFTRRDVQEILNAPPRPGENTEVRALLAELGMGGLPALLAGLERNMNFTPPEEKQINGHPFLILTGSWKPAWLKQFRGKSRRDVEVPDYLPDQVRLYLDKGTLFPRRIQYLKFNPDSGNREPMLTLSFLNVVLNGGIEPGEFEFVPPDGVIPTDTTQKYIPKPPSGAKKTPEGDTPPKR